MWESFYPPAGLDRAHHTLLRRLEATIPAFVALLVNHRPRSLRGRSLIEVLDVRGRQPARLAALYGGWLRAPGQMYRAAPSLVFAVLSQARADGRLTPEDETQLLTTLLTHWAIRSSLYTSESCIVPARSSERAGDRRALRTR